MRAKRSVIPIFVPHLGCPNMCVFCNQNRISGSGRAPDGKETEKLITEALDKLPPETEKTVAFYGGSFTAIPAAAQEELLSAAYGFIENGRISSLRVSTRPDCVDGAVLERLWRYGVRTVELGVQSMDDNVLRASGRGHSAEDAEIAAKMVKRRGFELILQMMTGLPEDTPERSVYTAEKLIALNPDGVRIYPTVIIKDTPLYDMWKSGNYKEHTVEDAVELCARLADLFGSAGIPIIRLGLNPTEDLSGGDAAAGAYHPALGELVENRRYLKKELALLTEADRGKKTVIFAVAKGAVSKASGQKRRNRNYIMNAYNIERVIFREAELPAGTVLRVDR